MYTLNTGMGRPMKLNVVNVADIVSHYYGIYTFYIQGNSIEEKNVEEHLKKHIIANDWPLQWATGKELSTPGTAAPGIAAPGIAAPGIAALGIAAPGTAALGTAALGSIARFYGGVAIFSVPPRTPINYTIIPGKTASRDRILVI